MTTLTTLTTHYFEPCFGPSFLPSSSPLRYFWWELPSKSYDCWVKKINV